MLTDDWPLIVKIDCITFIRLGFSQPCFTCNLSDYIERCNFGGMICDTSAL